MNDQVRESAPQPPPERAAKTPTQDWATLLAVAGWIVPGLGHALQKMWGRALAVFLAVGALVILGAGMRGNLFTSRGEDAFATLGYLADLGSGSFYWIARSIETAGPDVSHSAGDY